MDESELELFADNDNDFGDLDTALAYRAELDQKILDHDPDKLFIPFFVAICFDVFDLPMELLDLIPIGGWMLTGGITISEGVAFWLMLLGKGTFLRARMRFWLWVWTFFEAMVPFGALFPMRTIVIAVFAAKNRKIYRRLVAEREDLDLRIAQIQTSQVTMPELENIPDSNSFMGPSITAPGAYNNDNSIGSDDARIPLQPLRAGKGTYAEPRKAA